jgi:hypothetical protein
MPQPQPQKSKFELGVDLIKALAWPLFSIIVLFSFWPQLHSTMDQLPDLLKRSNTITIGDLTIILSRNIREPSAEVKKVLSEITPIDIPRLMRIEQRVWLLTDANDAKINYADLLRLGLLEEIPTQDLPENSTYGVQLTQLGRDTQKYLSDLLLEFVDQLNQPTSTPSP